MEMIPGGESGEEQDRAPRPLPARNDLGRAVEPIPLTVETLHRLDRGLPAATINNQLCQAIEDCHQRPQVAKARAVTIKIEVHPRDASGNRLSVGVSSDMKLPPSGVANLEMGYTQTRDPRTNRIKSKAAFFPQEAEDMFPDEPKG